MILLFLRVNRIRMYQGAERTAMDHQPWDESAKLGGGEEVDFEHGDGMRAYGAVEEGVYAEFGDCHSQSMDGWLVGVGVEYLHSRRIRSQRALA